MPRSSRSASSCPESSRTASGVDKWCLRKITGLNTTAGCGQRAEGVNAQQLLVMH